MTGSASGDSDSHRFQAAGHHTATSQGTAAAPSAADANQSSTASFLIDSLNASARLHQPPRGIGKESHPGSGPSSGLTLGNIMADSGTAPGKGPNQTNAGGAAPAAADPAQTSTAASLTSSLNQTSKLSHQKHGVSGPTLGNLADESGRRV